MDKKRLSPIKSVRLYKNQKMVEKGFRFLKDPIFLTSTLFLKSSKWMIAITMIMAICLLVYSAIVYHIKESLQGGLETFPDRKGKPLKSQQVDGVPVF